jgi:hypothetical protein
VPSREAHEDLVEEVVPLARGELSVLRPRDSEELLDEDSFEHEEFLPYWAELWPSGVALAHDVSVAASGSRASRRHSRAGACWRPTGPPTPSA